jgi:hypothetical protein
MSGTQLMVRYQMHSILRWIGYEAAVNFLIGKFSLKSHSLCCMEGHEDLCTKRKREKFLPEEDMKLKQLVEKYGLSSWIAIAAELPGRNVRQCRERWKHYLSSDPTKSEWTVAESRLLFEKMQMIGPKWTHLTAFFPGKTDVQIKEKWMRNFGNTAPKRHGRRKQCPSPEAQRTLPASPEARNARMDQSVSQPAVQPPSQDSTDFTGFSSLYRDSSFGSRSFSDFLPWD